MKQSAVEFLISKIELKKTNDGLYLLPFISNEIIIQAKEKYNAKDKILYTDAQLKKAFSFYAERPIVDIKYLDDDFTHFIESLKND